jgi:putative peptide zinc metalloprotease protein
MPEADAVIRALVPENDVDRVRSTPAEAMIRLDDAPWQEIGPAEVRRMVPSAGRRLPSAALASANGGPFATDPTAKEANTSLSSFFEVDIALPASQIADHWGTRAWVRFDHGTAPVGVRLYRRIRQVFLSRFSV